MESGINESKINNSKARGFLNVLSDIYSTQL
jgi:hypothetical protein